MNRIGFLSVLLLAFASISVCSRSPSYWIVMEANEDVQATDWDQEVCVSFDFRGRFDKFGLIVGTSQDLQKVTQLSITKPGSARLIAHYHDAKYPLWVLESETESVHNEVKRFIHKDWIKYEHTVTNKYSLVVMGYKNSSVDLVAHLPVTIISVSSSRQLPLSPLNVPTDVTVEPNPLIVELIEQISQEELKANVEKLSSIFTRLATSSGAVEAQHLLEEKLKALGLDVISFPFRDKYSADVIGELKGVEAPDEIIIISAHYDSRSTSLSNPDLRAPGADDNGSGSSNTLEIARVFTQSTIKFKHTLRFCFWSGEEQGLYGSKAYAKKMKENGEKIIAVLNGDMLGWKLPNKEMTIGMSNRYISKPLNDLVNSITRIYVPDIGIGSTSACCSDHQSFYEYGFPSVGFFENTGSATSYPHYHKSTDLPEYLNYEQITLISKAIAASAATLAVPLQQ